MSLPNDIRLPGKFRWLLSAAVFVLFAVVFAFTDWQISQTLYNPAAGWAQFMEAYGQMPGYFLGFLCGSFLLRTYTGEMEAKRAAKSPADVIGLAILTTFGAFGFFEDAFGGQLDTEQVNLPLVIVSGIAAVIVAQIILRRFPLETVSQYRAAAKVGLAVVIIGGFITVWAIKIPWGRWTYRDILAAGNTALFTPWYLPQGFTGHYSFPSGHTALGFSVLPLILFLKKGHRGRNLLLAVLLGWGIIVGISRIVIGAHFASDVLFSAGEILLWFWIFRKKFLPESFLIKKA